MDSQVIIFGAGIVGGIVSGIGADGYRAWRSAVRSGHRATVVSDCLCWCVLAACLSALLFYLNGGEVRSYFLAALLIGYLCYRYLAGDRIVHLWWQTMRLVRRICRGLQAAAKTVCMPIAVILRWCGHLLGRPRRKSPPEDKI
ncbi:MAG: spore cortex biosynthesis protein YabQ [Selenomonadales bacterium]|nr:spore cortex biosynthesis protein YabQ [Selenomonadales bacterium]